MTEAQRPIFSATYVWNRSEVPPEAAVKTYYPASCRSTFAKPMSRSS
jgi:hypothetical protein